MDDAVTANGGAPITIGVLANDLSSADPASGAGGGSSTENSLAIAALGTAAHGTTELRPADSTLWDCYATAQGSPIGGYLDPYGDGFYDASQQTQQQIDAAENESQQEAHDSATDYDTDPTVYELPPNGTTTGGGTNEGSGAGPTDETIDHAEVTDDDEADKGDRAFELPDGIVFTTTTLPADADDDDLMAFYVSPSEWTVTQTITNVFSTSETFTPRNARAAGEDVEQETGQPTAGGSTTEYRVGYPSETGATEQPVADGEGSPDNDATDDDHAAFDPATQEQTITRTGISTWSITVINGTQTVMTYSMTDTSTFETGSLPGTDETDDESKWEVPDEWTAAAVGPTMDGKAEDEAEGPSDAVVFAPSADSDSGSKAEADVWGDIFGANGGQPEPESDPGDGSTPTDSGSDDEGDDEESDAEETAAEPPAEKDFYGARSQSVSTFTITIIETKVTLPDGTTGRTYSFSYDTSQTFVSLSAGRFSINESEGEIQPVVPEDDDNEDVEKEQDDGGALIYTVGELADSETSGAAGAEDPDQADPSDTAADDGEDEDAPIDLTKVKGGGNGKSIQASSKFMNFGRSASHSNFNMSMTVPEGATDEQSAAATVTGGMSMDLSSSSGNLQANSLQAAKQTTTGAEADGNESFSSLLVVSDDSSGGSSHFSLNLGFDFDTSETSPETTDAAATSATSTHATTGPPSDTATADGTSTNDDGDEKGEDEGDDKNSLTFGNNSFGSSEGKAVRVDRGFSKYTDTAMGREGKSLTVGGMTAGGSSSYSNSVQFTEDGLTISVRNTVNNDSHHENLYQHDVQTVDAPEITFDESTYSGVYSVDTVDDDFETTTVIINSSSITTGYNISVGEEGANVDEIFDINITSSHERDLHDTKNSTYEDYMGSSNVSSSEEKSNDFNQTTITGNLKDGITVTKTNTDSLSKTAINNGVAQTPVAHSNTPDPVVITISLSGDDEAEASPGDGGVTSDHDVGDSANDSNDGIHTPSTEDLRLQHDEALAEVRRLEDEVDRLKAKSVSLDISRRGAERDRRPGAAERRADVAIEIKANADALAQAKTELQAAIYTEDIARNELMEALHEDFRESGQNPQVAARHNTGPQLGPSIIQSNLVWAIIDAAALAVSAPGLVKGLGGSAKSAADDITRAAVDDALREVAPKGTQAAFDAAQGAWKQLPDDVQKIMQGITLGTKPLSDFTKLPAAQRQAILDYYRATGANASKANAEAARQLNQHRIDFLNGLRSDPPGGIGNFPTGGGS